MVNIHNKSYHLKIFFHILSFSFLDAPRPKMDSDSDDGPTRSPAGSPKRGFSSPKSDDEQKQEETRIEVQIPKINTNLGDNIHFVRLVL